MLTNCFPIDNAPECKSSMEAWRGQLKIKQELRVNNKGVNKQKMLLNHMWPPHPSAAFVVKLCFCPPLHISELILRDSVGAKIKAFSPRSPCWLWLICLNALKLHKQLLYLWGQTRPKGSSRACWEQTFLCNPFSQFMIWSGFPSSSCCTSLTPAAAWANSSKEIKPTRCNWGAFLSCSPGEKVLWIRNLQFCGLEWPSPKTV